MSFIINLDYLRSWNAIFKILQLVLGTICVGIIGHDFNTILYPHASASFFLIATTTFYIGTFILFISYLLSPSAASVIPKTIYELVYHAIASLLLLSGSIAMMVYIHKTGIKGTSFYKTELAASIFCLLNTGLYICSAVMGFSTYGDD